MGPLTQWRGQSDTTLGRFGWGFLMSLLLHAPLTPLAALFGLLTLLTATEPPPEVLPQLTGIPVDLIEGEEAEAPPPEATPPPAPEPAVALEPPEDKPARDPNEPKIRDAGVADAEASDAAPDADDAGTAGDDAGVVDGGITDPVAASGAERIADVNANVQIKIFTEKIRSHPLAPRISLALAAVPQWRDFFGPAALDPVKDIDRLLVWGPQLRDSSEVGVVAKVNVPKERVLEAFEGIVRTDPAGAWLDAGVPEITARVDRAPRHIMMLSPTIVVVTPPSGADNARKAKKLTLKPSPGAEVVTARLKTPWRAFRGTGIPIDIPKSIGDAHFKVTPDEYGGAIVEVVAKDESAENASENAAQLERTLRSLTNYNIFGIRMKFVERIVFTTKGEEIHGYALLTAGQLRQGLDFAMEFLGARATRPRRERGKPDASVSGSPPETMVPTGPSRQPPSANPPAKSPTQNE